MSAPRTVLLHVGTPKTGTSFVQDLLFHHRRALAEQGVLYPGDRFDAHFLAALDLLELSWGGLEQQSVGAWERLAAQARSWAGTVIVSHEILARASQLQVQRALASLGDCELHVVISARDLVRQVPAEWQENVKHRRTLTYSAFLEAITDPEPQREVAGWFWGVQDVPAILRRWGRHVPPERVHVVTVPKPGAPPTLLWERFAEAFELAPEDFDLTLSERVNPSLGVAETELLRRLNLRVNGGVLDGEHYREFVRELLAHRTLSRREGKEPLVLPPRLHPWAARRAREWVDEIAAGGYHVIGDLADLLPDATPHLPASTDFVDPAMVTAEQREDVALTALATVLQSTGDLRDEVTRLHHELDHTRAERDLAWRQAGLSIRLRRKVVASSQTSRPLALLLAAYRRLRGR